MTSYDICKKNWKKILAGDPELLKNGDETVKSRISACNDKATKAWKTYKEHGKKAERDQGDLPKLGFLSPRQANKGVAVAKRGENKATPRSNQTANRALNRKSRACVFHQTSASKQRLQLLKKTAHRNPLFISRSVY